MIREYALEGLPLNDIYIFDVHGHLGSARNMQIPAPTASSLIRTMDQLGVNAICVSSIPSLSTDCRYGNDQIQAATQQHPKRIYGYVSATPYDPGFQFQNYFTDKTGMLGIKIHAMMNQTSINDPGYLPYLEFANLYRLPVLFHAWTLEEVTQASKLAEQFNNCPLILAHAGLTAYAAKTAAIEAVKKYENIFLDTAISSTYDGAIEWIVSKVGASRVLYGSDCMFFDCRHTLGKMALSHLSDYEKELIFGLNAKNLFDVS